MDVIDFGAARLRSAHESCGIRLDTIFEDVGVGSCRGWFWGRKVGCMAIYVPLLGLVDDNLGEGWQGLGFGGCGIVRGVVVSRPDLVKVKPIQGTRQVRPVALRWHPCHRRP